MNDSKPADHSVTDPEEFVRLRAARHGLLHLHKLLLDSERAAYEQIYGPVAAGTMLGLVVNDPQFAWLHAISELIVRIDEMFDADEPATAADAAVLAEEVRKLLIPAETGDEFARKYLAALQSDPDVILAHRDTVKALARDADK